MSPTRTPAPAPTAIPPALARVVRAVRARADAERELQAALAAAKVPNGPHTVADVLQALAVAGLPMSRAKLYTLISTPRPTVELDADDAR